MLRLATAIAAAAVVLGTAAPASATTVTITGDSFPGSDHALGTADDQPVSIPGFFQVQYFHDEFAHLAGGVGVYVDSSSVFNGMENTGVGALVNYVGLGHVFGSARPDVPGGQAFSAAALRFRFVDSTSGAAATVDSASIWAGVDQSNIYTQHVSFYGLQHDLLYSLTFTGPGQTVSYEGGGIASIEVTTDFSVLADTLTFSYGGNPPGGPGGDVPVPEPGSLALAGAALLAGRARRRRAA